jgi:hypothetical protein
MNYIVLNPQFPSNYYYFYEKLKEKNINILAIGDIEYFQLKPELRYLLTEYYKVNSLENYDDILRAIGFFIHKYGRIDYINSLNSKFLLKEANLRTDFNIKGIKPEIFNLLNNLDIILELQSFSNISVDNFRDFYSSFNIPSLPLNEIKDIYITTSIISDENKLFNTFTFHIYRNNNSYIVKIEEFQENLFKSIEYFVENFELKNNFISIISVKDSSRNDLVVKVVPTLVSAIFPDMINYACENDIYHCWANLISKEEIELFTIKFPTCLVSRNNSYVYKNSNEKIIEKYQKNICISGNFKDICSQPFIQDYSFLIKAETEEELKEIVAFIIE